MRALAPLPFLAALLGLFSERLQRGLRNWFHRRPVRIFLVPAVLGGYFSMLLAAGGNLTPGFTLLLAAYVLAPSALVYWSVRAGRSESWLDLLAVLLLWLPVEFSLGRNWLPSRAYGIANELAQGTAFTLALLLLVVCRAWQGANYRAPRRLSDLRNTAIGLAVAVVLLAPPARLLNFIGPFRLSPDWSVAGFLRLFLITLVGVAIPEEVLFRSLIQTWLMRRLGESDRTVLVAALIFGAAHLNNAPGPLPNWRYMILAAIAGFIYGKVFQKSTSVLCSASLHALVNSMRRVFFL